MHKDLLMFTFPINGYLKKLMVSGFVSESANISRLLLITIPVDISVLY